MIKKNFLSPDTMSSLNTNGYDIAMSRQLDHVQILGQDLILVEDRIPNSLEGPPVKYKLNKYGFRSDPFKKLGNSKINILTAGCSWTYGEGIPTEYVWPEVLSNKIKEKAGKEVCVYNLGVKGGSIQLSVKNLMAFIRTYGKPDYIFAEMPNFSRNIAYNEKEKYFMNITIDNHISRMGHGTKSEKDTFKRYTMNYVEEEKMLEASMLMSLLEEFCDAAGIKLLWSAYAAAFVFRATSDGANTSFKHFIFDNHVWNKDNSNKYRKASDIQVYPNINNLPYWATAKDDAHPGTAWHEHISNLFFDELCQRKWV